VVARADGTSARTLTTGQRAGIAYKLIPLYEAEAKKRQVEAVKRSHRSGARKTLVVADRPQLASTAATPIAPKIAEREKVEAKSREKAARAAGARKTLVVADRPQSVPPTVRTTETSPPSQIALKIAERERVEATVADPGAQEAPGRPSGPSV